MNSEGELECAHARLSLDTIDVLLGCAEEVIENSEDPDEIAQVHAARDELLAYRGFIDDGDEETEVEEIEEEKAA